MTALIRPFLILKEALSAGEDYWTWRTVRGETYEDVVLLKLNRTNVTIEHKYGLATIDRADLPEPIQQGLIENFEMAEPDEVYSSESAHAPFMHGFPLAHAK